MLFGALGGMIAAFLYRDASRLALSAIMRGRAHRRRPLGLLAEGEDRGVGQNPINSAGLDPRRSFVASGGMAGNDVRTWGGEVGRGPVG